MSPACTWRAWRSSSAAELDKRAGHVQAGDIVLLRTDWPRKVDVASEKFWRDAPFTARSACDWLVARRVKAVGYDYPPDYTVRTPMFSPGTPVPREECTTHHVFFPAGLDLGQGGQLGLEAQVVRWLARQ